MDNCDFQTGPLPLDGLRELSEDEQRYCGPSYIETETGEELNEERETWDSYLNRARSICDNVFPPGLGFLLFEFDDPNCCWGEQFHPGMLLSDEDGNRTDDDVSDTADWYLWASRISGSFENVDYWDTYGERKNLILEYPHKFYENKGYTLLMHAAEVSPLPEAIPELIADGFGVNERDETGYTALAYAAKFDGDSSEFVSALLEAGANPHAQMANGTTALMLAAKAHNEGVIRCLLDAGVDVNETDDDGKTPLMYAASGLFRHFPYSLLTEGLNLKAVSGEGKTYKDYARESYNERMIR